MAGSTCQLSARGYLGVLFPIVLELEMTVGDALLCLWLVWCEMCQFGLGASRTGVLQYVRSPAHRSEQEPRSCLTSPMVLGLLCLSAGTASMSLGSTFTHSTDTMRPKYRTSLPKQLTLFWF